MAHQTPSTYPNRSGAAVNVHKNNGTARWHCTGCQSTNQANSSTRQIIQAAQDHATVCAFLPDSRNSN